MLKDLNVMRKFMLFACFLVFGLTQAQEVKPVYEHIEDDLVKVTYFYKDGKVKKQGFFNGKKITGTWATFDTSGKKTGVAKYRNGKKVGKWLLLTNDGIREVVYKNNAVVSVKTFYKDDGQLALK